MKSIKRLGVAVLNWVLQGFVYASEGPVRYYLTKPIVFSSVEHLTAALKRAAGAHHKFEETYGKGADEQVFGPGATWADWYAKYMSAEPALRTTRPVARGF